MGVLLCFCFLALAVGRWPGIKRKEKEKSTDLRTRMTTELFYVLPGFVRKAPLFFFS
jgi:hypothetical protein